MISLVIPVYNNNDCLNELQNAIHTVLGNENYEILFINDGSTDGSRETLNQLANNLQQVKVIHLAKNFGQHPAISAGFEHASGEILVLMDADLEDDPAHLPNLISSIKSGHDICFTIKEEPKSWSLKNLLSLIYHALVGSIFKEQNPSNLGTYRAFNKKVLNALLSYPERQILYGPLMHHMGFHRNFIKVKRNPRPHSSYTLLKRAQLAINSLIAYSDLPHRVFFWSGTTIFLLTIAYAIVSLTQYFFFGQQLMSGLTLVVMILLVMMSTLMTGLGIIGSYVFRVFQEVLHRPRYLIQEKRNLP